MHVDHQTPTAPGPAARARKHAEERASTPWSSEAVLDLTEWGERAPETRAPGAPPALEQRNRAPARRRIGRAVAVPAVAGAVAFAIAVVIAIVLTMLQLRPAAEASEQITREVAAGESSHPSAAAPAQTGPVLVHVVGEVAEPGVVELPAGARVAEAIEAAGGAGEHAELSGVNLARLVTDGEQILVPDAQQAEAGAVAAPGGEASPGARLPAGGPIDLNTADAAALETLPRVGPALAQRILDWRASNGGFTAVDQLMEVSGIGAKTLDGLRELVTVR